MVNNKPAVSVDVMLGNEEDFTAAHGAFAMTTSSDTTMATLAEVERAMCGTSARASR